MANNMDALRYIKTTLKNEQGVALIITLLCITLIIAVTVQFNMAMRSDIDSTANFKNRIQLSHAARSGFDYALSVLYEDALASPQVDSILETWADPELLNADAVAAYEVANFQVAIYDHSGKISVNSLLDQAGIPDENQRQILTRLFVSQMTELENQEVDDLINAIIDWIDENDLTTGFGDTEDSYYQGLDNPYSCRNGKLETLEELLLIKGMTPEVFDKVSGFLTVHGDGNININTAAAPVLAALDELMTDELAANMVAYREEIKDHNLEDPNWYQNVPGIDPNIITFKNTATVSTHFEIMSAGSIGKMKKIIHGTVLREIVGPKLTVLARNME